MVDTRPRECWRNALLICLETPGSVYVEGFAVTGHDALVCEHGWVELDGRVIEPTNPGAYRAYYAGLRYSPHQAQAQLDETGGALPLVWAGGGPSDPDRAAYKAAYDKALENAQPSPTDPGTIYRESNKRAKL